MKEDNKEKTISQRKKWRLIVEISPFWLELITFCKKKKYMILVYIEELYILNSSCTRKSIAKQLTKQISAPPRHEHKMIAVTARFPVWKRSVPVQFQNVNRTVTKTTPCQSRGETGNYFPDCAPLTFASCNNYTNK